MDVLPHTVVAGDNNEAIIYISDDDDAISLVPQPLQPANSGHDVSCSVHDDTELESEPESKPDPLLCNSCGKHFDDHICPLHLHFKLLNITSHLQVSRRTFKC